MLASVTFAGAAPAGGVDVGAALEALVGAVPGLLVGRAVPLVVALGDATAEADAAVEGARVEATAAGRPPSPQAEPAAVRTARVSMAAIRDGAPRMAGSIAARA
jgi:hypothetical protein